MLARNDRMKTGARYRPIVNAGSVRLQTKEAGSAPMPDAGNRWSCKLRMRIRTRPSQNAGIAKVTIITNRMAWSGRRFALIAE